MGADKHLEADAYRISKLTSMHSLQNLIFPNIAISKHQTRITNHHQSRERERERERERDILT